MKAQLALAQLCSWLLMEENSSVTPQHDLIQQILSLPSFLFYQKTNVNNSLLALLVMDCKLAGRLQSVCINPLWAALPSWFLFLEEVWTFLFFSEALMFSSSREYRSLPLFF